LKKISNIEKLKRIQKITNFNFKKEFELRNAKIEKSIAK